MRVDGGDRSHAISTGDACVAFSLSVAFPFLFLCINGYPPFSRSYSKPSTASVDVDDPRKCDEGLVPVSDRRVDQSCEEPTRITRRNGDGRASVSPFGLRLEISCTTIDLFLLTHQVGSANCNGSFCTGADLQILRARSRRSHSSGSGINSVDGPHEAKERIVC